MSAPVPPGWSAHEIQDGPGRFQVLVRRTYRRGSVAGQGTRPSSAATAHHRSIAPGTSEPPGAIERTGADESPVEPRNSARGHNAHTGAPGSGVVTPPPPRPVAGVVSPAAITFGDLASVRAMGTGIAGLVVGCDTEFTTSALGIRVIDSYQFAVPDPFDPTFMVQVVILTLDERRISLHTALWEVVRAARLWDSPLVRDGVDDRGVRRATVLGDDGPVLALAIVVGTLRERRDVTHRHRRPTRLWG